ncbi:MAG: GNAT family N-acetyltransferase [Alkalibacterium sp.]|nr:GNAT family N-acetyltransferase [Alkalibacterium sp.]
MTNNLYFRAFEYDDLNFLNHLRNDPETFEYTCGNKFYISSEWDKKWIEDKINNNHNQLFLMVCRSEDDRPIGYIGITNIDFINRKAQFGGIVISKEFSGVGYGTETTHMLLNHVFNELGFNMIYGYWRADHLSSIKMAKKAGFSEIGLFPDFVYKQGKFYDAYILSIKNKNYL